MRIRMTVSYVGTNGTASVEDAVLFGGDHATSVSGSSYTYNYEGDDATLIITDNKGGVYPSGITVTYPVTGPADPTTGESKNIVVTFPSGTPTYSENTSVITFSGNRPLNIIFIINFIIVIFLVIFQIAIRT